VRGGAIPLMVWGTLVAILLALNWVWTGDAIQVASFGFTVVTVIGWVLVLSLRRPRREAVRRGPPGPPDRPEAVTSASYGAVLLAIGAAAAVFGLAFGHFLVYFGIGLAVLAVGVIVRERRAQRAAERHAERAAERHAQRAAERRVGNEKPS